MAVSDVVRPGFKCNMTDIAAALGCVQLGRLDEFQRRRREVVARYNAAFAEVPHVTRPAHLPDVDHAWHLYVLRLDLEDLTIDRERFIDELAARNIGSSVHFIPLHQMTYYRERYRLSDDQFPTASAEFPRMVSLPLNPRMSDRDVDDVAAAVADIIAVHHT